MYMYFSHSDLIDYNLILKFSISVLIHKVQYRVYQGFNTDYIKVFEKCFTLS
eukprot:SAG11_NODE_526_length_8740_cov_27.364194_5_plen_52_part_00